MFFASNCYGTAALIAAYEQVPIEQNKRTHEIAKHLGISDRTFTDYLTGKRTAPRAVVYAVWHESHLGRSVVTAHSEYGEYLARSMVRSLESKLSRLEATIAALNAELAHIKRTTDKRTIPMNDPVFAYG